MQALHNPRLVTMERTWWVSLPSNKGRRFRVSNTSVRDLVISRAWYCWKPGGYDSMTSERALLYFSCFPKRKTPSWTSHEKSLTSTPFAAEAWFSASKPWCMGWAAAAFGSGAAEHKRRRTGTPRSPIRCCEIDVDTASSLAQHASPLSAVKRSSQTRLRWLDQLGLRPAPPAPAQPRLPCCLPHLIESRFRRTARRAPAY
jgi:hypothetical protein